MKKITTILLLLFVVCAEGQQWAWVKEVTGTSTLYEHTKLQRAQSGNLACLLSQLWYPSPSKVVYTSAAGDTLWKLEIPGLTINDLTIDKMGNVYTIGNFQDTIVVDKDTLIPMGGNDVLIAECAPGGSIINYRVIGSTRGEFGNAITINSAGLIVAGDFVRSFNVDTVHFVGSESAMDAFVLFLDSNFIAIQGQQTTSGGAHVQALGTDKNNNVYLLAQSWSSLAMCDTGTYVSENGQFLAKFDDRLNFVRLQLLTGHWSDGNYLTDMLFDSDNNLSMCYNTGGGGSATHYIRINTWDENGGGISNIGVVINGYAYMGIDSLDTRWIVGRDMFFAAYDKFTLIEIPPLQNQNCLIYDTSITHIPERLAAGNSNDLYLLASCNTNSAPLGTYTCGPNGSEFLAHYSLDATKMKTVSNWFGFYPNPANTKIQVVSSLYLEKATFYNQAGDFVMNKEINSVSQIVDISDLEKGFYLMRLTGKAGQVYNCKFVKE